MPPTPLNYKAIKPSQETISPIVVTSKRAQNHLFSIQQEHAKLVQGLKDQKARVDSINQQKQAALQSEQTMKAAMQKEQMVNQTQASKDAMDFASKQAELDVKRAALSSRL